MQALMRLVQIKQNSFKYNLNEDQDHAKTGIMNAKILILGQKLLNTKCFIAVPLCPCVHFFLTQGHRGTVLSGNTWQICDTNNIEIMKAGNNYLTC